MSHELSPQATKLMVAALTAANCGQYDLATADRTIRELCDYVAQLEARVALLDSEGVHEPKPVTCPGCEKSWPLDGLIHQGPNPSDLMTCVRRP